eukprot:scaffold113562_cov74-Phaeocystis_antarctica.AAC.1
MHAGACSCGSVTSIPVTLLHLGKHICDVAALPFLCTAHVAHPQCLCAVCGAGDTQGRALYSRGQALRRAQLGRRGGAAASAAAFQVYTPHLDVVRSQHVDVDSHCALRSEPGAVLACCVQQYLDRISRPHREQATLPQLDRRALLRTWTLDSLNGVFALGGVPHCILFTK